MSEFANFIRVAIQGLPENTPAARAAAYDRARKAIKRQLESRGAGEAETREALDNVENAILDIEAEQSFTMPMPAQAAQPAPPPVASGAHVSTE